jgi:asparaginyl-tRNA synthetase
MEGEELSGRHLCSFFQVEIEWKTSDVDDVYRTIESVLSKMAIDLLARRRARGELTADAERRIALLATTPFERLPFAAARERVRGIGGNVNPHADKDLTHAEEEALARAAAAPFWVTEYPDGVRDSLYLRTQNGNFATYDLILPNGHGEVATGGLRPDSGDSIVAQARKLGEEPHPHYADWKRRTAIQTGGLGFGLERLVRFCSGAASVLDLRVAHDQGPNAIIQPHFVAAAE